MLFISGDLLIFVIRWAYREIIDKKFILLELTTCSTFLTFDDLPIIVALLSVRLLFRSCLAPI